jgi:hypothetical protein
VHQYYYADQGPTYSGPGNFAPYRTYREGGYGGYHHRLYHYGYGTHHYRPWAHTGYGYGTRYGYAPRHGYAPHFYAPRHTMRYGAPMGMPRYGYREHTLRRYY